MTMLVVSGMVTLLGLFLVSDENSDSFALGYAFIIVHD